MTDPGRFPGRANGRAPAGRTPHMTELSRPTDRPGHPDRPIAPGRPEPGPAPESSPAPEPGHGADSGPAEDGAAHGQDRQGHAPPGQGPPERETGGTDSSADGAVRAAAGGAAAAADTGTSGARATGSASAAASDAASPSPNRDPNEDRNEDRNRPSDRGSHGSPNRGRAWAELLRVPAVFSVPGDALAGAAAAGHRANRGTALAVCASLCLYEAGMALNDWADRTLDAGERPHRPIPSGRIAPGAALGTAAGLTAAGLGLAAAAGRPALATATTLAGTVWAYDLWLKNTPAGPAAMAAARGLDLLLGTAATATAAARADVAAPRPSRGRLPHAAVRTRRPAPGTGAGREARRALPSAALLAAHTYGVTLVSRRETTGGSTALPLAALAAVGGIARSAGRNPAPDRASWPDAPRRRGSRGVRRTPPPPGRPAPPPTRRRTAARPAPGGDRPAAGAAFAALYGATAARPLLHAALNPSPHFYQRAVGGGIRAMIPLQASLAARAGRTGTATALLALVPLARRLSRKVSPT
ncbi:SCO3242 family prenyltransferase [Streptomyces sp. S07_1.15]|uniref:SCO3242 family prenyltransferase n=1 Tax=Streptomyces sp. S07_1.15 TaxID=2873925 RepID=UPI0035A846FD